MLECQSFPPPFLPCLSIGVYVDLHTICISYSNIHLAPRATQDPTPSYMWLHICPPVSITPCKACCCLRPRSELRKLLLKQMSESGWVGREGGRKGGVEEWERETKSRVTVRWIASTGTAWLPQSGSQLIKDAHDWVWGSVSLAAIIIISGVVLFLIHFFAQFRFSNA